MYHKIIFTYLNDPLKNLVKALGFCYLMSGEGPRDPLISSFILAAKTGPGGNSLQGTLSG
jgi:hypothetical protein